MNENKNTTFRNLQDIVKVTFRGKFIAVKPTLKRKKNIKSIS